MDLDAFTSRLGDGQGRLAAPDREIVFVLGDADPGRMFELRAGDYVEVMQTTDLTGIALVRAAVRLRVAKGLAANLGWEVAVLVDGVKRARTACSAGRTRTLGDLAANVSKVSGVHDIGVRLELVAL